MSAGEILRGVERVARALGVLVTTLAEGTDSLQVFVWDVRIRMVAGRSRADVDPLTAALVLLGYASNLRVGVGECRACRGRRSVYVRMHGHDAEMAAREAGWECRGGDFLTGESEWIRPCPYCSIDGKPTGRQAITWEAAIITAMPQSACKRSVHGYQHNVPSNWCADGFTPPAGVDTWERADGATMWRKPGDGTTREALRVMAHTIAGPEHIAVTSDWCESGNALSDFRGEPQGGLGEMVAVWLRGPCERCLGDGYTSLTLGLYGDRTPNPCPACHGHGHALGRLDDQVLAMLHEAAEQAEGPAAIEVSA